jgi:hypothetical protein
MENLLDFVSKLAVTVASILGSGFLVYRFKKSREAEGIGSDYPDEPIIFEPNSTETYHVFFSTDYSGPIWVRAELMDKDEYSWVADRMFILSNP